MNGSKHDSSPARPDALDIWQFSADVSDRLLLWNAVNVAAGLFFARRRGILRGICSQSVGWGIANIAIAALSRRAGEIRFDGLCDPYALDTQARDTRNLRLLLVGNGLLDLVYIRAGLWMFRRASRPFVRGVGLGIVLQGALLCLFDWRMFRRSLLVRPRDPNADRTRAARLEAL